MNFQTCKILKIKHGNGNKLHGNNSFSSQFFNASKRQNIFTQLHQHDFVNNKSSKTCSNLCHQMGRSTQDCEYFFKFTIFGCKSFDRNFSMARQRGTSSRALQLLSTTRQSEFCIALLVLKNVFGYSVVLCKVKQKKSINSLAAVNIAHDIADELKCLRKKAEYEFH